MGRWAVPAARREGLKGEVARRVELRGRVGPSGGAV